MAYSGDTPETKGRRRKSLEDLRPNLAITPAGDLPDSYGVKREGTNIMANLCLNLVLLGRTRAGKSASGNTILGHETFKSKRSPKAVTQDVASETGTVCGLPVTVYDTPGFSGTESTEELLKYEEVLQRCESGLCAFLLVIKADRFTGKEREAVEKIEELLGEKHIKNTWILFTGGDLLEDANLNMNEFLNETEALKKLTQKYEGRFHVFNNQTKGESVQVKSLICKVFQNNLKNLPKSVNIQDIPASSLSSRRIVLLGKTGVGKSASGNTILGQREFRSEGGKRSVTTECSEKHATVSGRKVSVVDTPPFFDTKMNPETFLTEMMRSAYLSSPGPHAFLIVFSVNMRITDQELQIAQIIEMMFGEEVLKYSIVLFTHGDQLEGKDFRELIKENSRLRDLVQRCGGRFHVFNNEDVNNRDQVNDLLQKIDTMIEENGGGHYSNQMYEDAQRFRQEEKEQKQGVNLRHEETALVFSVPSVNPSGSGGQLKTDTERSKEESKSEKKSYFSKYFLFSALGAALSLVAAPFVIAVAAVGTAVAAAATAAAPVVLGGVGVAPGTVRGQSEEKEEKQEEKNDETGT